MHFKQKCINISSFDGEEFFQFLSLVILHSEIIDTPKNWFTRLMENKPSSITDESIATFLYRSILDALSKTNLCPHLLVQMMPWLQTATVFPEGFHGEQCQALLLHLSYANIDIVDRFSVELFLISSFPVRQPEENPRDREAADDESLPRENHFPKVWSTTFIPFKCPSHINALHTVARSGNLLWLKKMVKDNPGAFSLQDEGGNLLLHAVTSRTGLKVNIFRYVLGESLQTSCLPHGGLLMKNKEGVTPIALLLRIMIYYRRCEVYQPTKQCMYSIFRLCPRAFGVKDENGELPIHFAARHGLGWLSGTRSIVWSNLVGLQEIDPRSGLYPAMLFAASEKADLNSIFWMLRTHAAICFGNELHTSTRVAPLEETRTLTTS